MQNFKFLKIVMKKNTSYYISLIYLPTYLHRNVCIMFIILFQNIKSKNGSTFFKIEKLLVCIPRKTATNTRGCEIYWNLTHFIFPKKKLTPYEIISICLFKVSFCLTL